MAAEITDLEQMMKTLEQASTDPNGVTVGDFAKAVQSLQSELKMLETEVSRLGDTVGSAFGPDDDGISVDADIVDGVAHQAAAAE